MDVRVYVVADSAACLAIFDSNTPPYFAEEERTAFETFLNSPPCPYFVMEHDDAILGCGGYRIESDGQSTRLVWGMIAKQSHRLGLGRYLLLYRLREIGKAGDIPWVTLNTSPNAAQFFEKQGFRVTGTEPDGYGPGLDRVAMTKKIAVCA